MDVVLVELCQYLCTISFKNVIFQHSLTEVESFRRGDYSLMVAHYSTFPCNKLETYVIFDYMDQKQQNCFLGNVQSSDQNESAYVPTV